MNPLLRRYAKLKTKSSRKKLRDKIGKIHFAILKIEDEWIKRRTLGLSEYEILDNLYVLGVEGDEKARELYNKIYDAQLDIKFPIGQYKQMLIEADDYLKSLGILSNIRIV